MRSLFGHAGKLAAEQRDPAHAAFPLAEKNRIREAVS